MRNFFILPKDKVDVLILDTASSSLVSKCIPKNLTKFFVDLNNTIPIILNLNFFFILFKKILFIGFTSRALFSAIIETKNPKVIMTFIDNDSLIGDLSLLFPNKLFIVIQNGIRIDESYSLGVKNNGNVPVFFGFGGQQKNLLLKKGVSIKEYISVGSLRCGLFLSEYNKSISKKNKNTLCFISQYTKIWEDSKDQAFRDSNLILKSVFNNAVEWSIKNGFKINLAMRRSGVGLNSYEDELEFYSYKNNTEFISCYKSEPAFFSSYKAAHKSSVIISVGSTLAFEMFGLGYKVLFCPGTRDNRFITKKGWNDLFSDMPDFIKLESLEPDLFNKKLDCLNNMSENEYLTKTIKVREYFMVLDKSNPPHRAISDYIEDFFTYKN